MRTFIIAEGGSSAGKSCVQDLLLPVSTDPCDIHRSSECVRCSGGYLISVCSYNSDDHNQCYAGTASLALLWIGGILKGCFLWKQFCWTEGSHWNFGYWALGSPGNGNGCCVALFARGGRW
nr:proteoglycan 3-like [Symphalangus syndactylus]